MVIDFLKFCKPPNQPGRTSPGAITKTTIMEKYTQILARLQPGQSIARCEQGFQLKEGEAALSIVFPRVESLLMWFDREYPAKHPGAEDAPETGFYPYSLTCPCGRTLEGSIEAEAKIIHCECGEGVPVSAEQDKPEPEDKPNGEFSLANDKGHNLTDYVTTGWDFITPEHDSIAIDADGEVYSYLEQPTAGLAYCYSEQPTCNGEHPMWLDGVEWEKVTWVRLPDLANWQELIWQRPQK